MNTIIVAPHPDDEVLGAGGTLLRRKAEGAKVAWLIITAISVKTGWSAESVRRRAGEIQEITELLGFSTVFTLDFPTTQLDRIPMRELVAAISEVFKTFEPQEVFVPHSLDVHTDHRVVFDAVASCTKWFRQPSVKRVLAYETLSESDFGMGVGHAFRPNVFVDISPFLEQKIRAMDVYESELGVFPFPRSPDALRALASVRGAAAGYVAAEAFELLRERT